MTTYRVERFRDAWQPRCIDFMIKDENGDLRFLLVLLRYTKDDAAVAYVRGFGGKVGRYDLEEVPEAARESTATIEESLALQAVEHFISQYGPTPWPLC